jgi:uncharacterized membrane protein
VMVLGAARGRGLLAVAGFAFALACKQQVWLLVPLAAWWPSFGPRRTALSAGVAGLVTLPWFLVDPRAFLDDALHFHLDLDPRLDSLSLFTAVLRADGQPPFAIVGVITVMTIAAAALLLPRSPAGFALGAALVHSIFNVVNRHTFFNHWWLASGLVLLAVAAAADKNSVDKRQPA